jgi:Tfp pilus assembly PilM family ATPase
MRWNFIQDIAPFLMSLTSRKIIAIDLGSSHIKLAVAEESFGRIHMLQHRLIDLHQEGLLSQEEINKHLREVINDFGDHPLALAIPQHLVYSHLVDLPRVNEREMQGLIERETLNLSGLSDSAIVYDSRRLAPFGRHANPVWINLSRQNEIQSQMDRVAEDGEPRCFCEITSTANALVASYLAVAQAAERVALVDIGATCTVVAIVDRQQAVHASAFPIGSESFTNSIATFQGCSFEEAETLKRARNLFAGLDRALEIDNVVDIWRQDLFKLLKEWEDENPDSGRSLGEYRVVLSGGAIEQLGFVDYLRSKPGLEILEWPQLRTADGIMPLHRFAVAHGLILQSFNRSKCTTSLLPYSCRNYKKGLQRLMTANWISMGFITLIALLLIAGFIHKAYIGQAKQSLIDDAEAALKITRNIELFYQHREQEYQRIVPVVERQRRTMGLIKTFQIMQRVREINDLWFVALADRESYLAGNAAVVTNLNAPIEFITELFIPDTHGDKLKVLRNLVEELKNEPNFRLVDSLPISQRNTNVVDSKSFPADHLFPLHLELSDKARFSGASEASRKRGLNAEIRPKSE